MNIDRELIEGGADVVGFTGFGDLVEDVASDDHVVVPGNDTRQRGGVRFGVVGPTKDVAAVLDPAKEPVVDIPLVVGGDVDRIVPRPQRGVDALVLHGVGDRGVLAGDPAGGDGDRTDDEVRRRLEADLHRLEIVTDIVQFVAVLIDPLVPVGDDKYEYGPDRPFGDGE